MPLQPFDEKIKTAKDANFRLLRVSDTTPVAGLESGDYLVDESGKVAYRVARNFSPDLRAPRDELGRPEKLTGPQAADDQNTYRVWQRLDPSGGPAQRYLVREDGTPAYLVDPGINGTHRFRPNGQTVAKFDAPKATLMSYIIKGILSRKLPWALVLLGVMIAIVLEMSGIPSLAFAVGVYLPLSSSSPIWIGGIMRWLVDRYLKVKFRHKNLSEIEMTAEGDKSPGVLLASGYIAGGALAGIVIAFMAGVPSLVDISKRIEDWSTAHNPFFDGANSDLLACFPFLILCVLLYLVGRDILLAVRGAREASVNFHGRAFAVFGAALGGAFFAENGDAQVPDFVVDLAKSGFGKFVRRRELSLETRDTRKRAIDLIARQFGKNLLGLVDFRNPMTNHRQIVSRLDGAANCFLEAVLIQDRAHIEVVGHDQTIEAHFFAE